MTNHSYLFVCLAIVGCKKSDVPPPAPINGAPVAFVAGKLTPGTQGSIDVKAYNFSDKRVAQYALMLRYHDKAGAVLKVPFGVSDFMDVGFDSFSGKRYVCDPKSWCSYTIENVNVPATAASVEILATSVGSLKDDAHFDDKPLFEHDAMAWPAGSPR